MIKDINPLSLKRFKTTIFVLLNYKKEQRFRDELFSVTLIIN
jgi:hypothetical protein